MQADMRIANSRDKAYISLMTMLAFDTYRFVKDLTSAGMKAEQAEVLANSYAHLVNDQLATKDDLKALEQRLDLKIDGKIDALEQRLDAKIIATEQRLDGKIDALEQRLDGKIDTLEQRLNARIAYAQVATIVILSAVMTLLAFFGP